MATSLMGFIVLFTIVAILAVGLGTVIAALANMAAGLLGHPWVGRHGGPGTRSVRPRIPARVRRAVLKRDGYCCQECGATEDLEMDHIIAWSKGGASTESNLQVLCERCNERKGARP